MKTGLIALGIVLALGLGILIGFLLWGWWARPAVLPEKQGYDIFRDLITLTLTIGGIVIAIAGYFIYIVISEKTKLTAMSVVEERMEYVSAALLTFIGYSYWHSYHYRKTNDINDLNQAIDLTEDAYSHHSQKLDEQKYELLIL